MRIAVISPHGNNNGNTTLAMLIAFGFSSMEKVTCLAHIKPTSEAFYEYLGLEGYEDKTSSPSQIVKILKEGELTGEDVRDYCKRINDNFEAFTNNSTNFSQDDMNYMLKYMVTDFPHEHLILDMDGDDIEKTFEVIKACDVVVLNVSQCASELKLFKKDKEKIMRLFGNKPVVVVINKYNSVKSTLKEVACCMGVKRQKNWQVLHDNPWITWGTNHGKIKDVFAKIMSGDTRVAELKSEIMGICQAIIKAKVSKKD